MIRVGYIVLLMMLLAPSAAATTLRYALVIGTNVGVDDHQGRLPDLQFAEAEATRLYEKLLERCHFEAGSDRTLLLLRPTRKTFAQAIDRLATQAHQDRVTYGDVDLMFAFFFTGHGLQGRLLLSDGALPKRDLLALFDRVDADLNIGVFDACYSGSVGAWDLMPKGITVEPNRFNTLPKEILSVEGSVWLSSSGPDQVSYEDRNLGGVFTHFFTEALEHAPADGPAITLNRIWEYAQSKTRRHTGERGRLQTPRKVVTRLKAQGPLYFSFRAPRSATLIVEEGLTGRFLLSYADGQLAEVIEKSNRPRQTFAVYPGQAQLRIVSAHEVSQTPLTFMDGGTVILSRDTEWASPRFDRRHDNLLVKGSSETVYATTITQKSPILLGAEYERDVVPSEVLIPTQSIRFRSQLDRLELGAGYGWSSATFDSWRYDAQAGFAFLRSGWFWDTAWIRWDVLGGLRLGFLNQKYGDGVTRNAFFGQLELTARAQVLMTQDFGLALQVSGGPAWARGAGFSAGYFTSVWAGGNVGLFYRVR